MDYGVRFGSGNPASNTGLSPTFLVFADVAGNAITPPSLAEISTTGIYGFTFAPTLAIFFVCDGATTGLSSNDRYVVGAISPNDSAFQLVGDTASSFGTDAADPTTMFGFLKRLQELYEGDQDYTKATGVLDMYNRGSTTLLREKTIVDSASEITKS